MANSPTSGVAKHWSLSLPPAPIAMQHKAAVASLGAATSPGREENQILWATKTEASQRVLGRNHIGGANTKHVDARPPRPAQTSLKAPSLRGTFDARHRPGRPKLKAPLTMTKFKGWSLPWLRLYVHMHVRKRAQWGVRRERPLAHAIPPGRSWILTTPLGWPRQRPRVSSQRFTRHQGQGKAPTLNSRLLRMTPTHH